MLQAELLSQFSMGGVVIQQYTILRPVYNPGAVLIAENLDPHSIDSSTLVDRHAGPGRDA